MDVKRSVYIGVDVGTGSVRSVASEENGSVIGSCVTPITVHNPAPDFYEQDSEEIWDAVCTTVKEVCKSLNTCDKVCGLGFDATCSMVVLDELSRPLTVDISGDNRWNIIMWMDHRASTEATFINSKPYNVLSYVGGKVSVEMQAPKLLWLKKHLPNTWMNAKHFFDLPDYLTFKATGKNSRSLCSLVCKWAYVHDGQNQYWDADFFNDIGLGDLVEDSFRTEVLSPGSVCGYLTKDAAFQLGIPEGVPVAASLIDAHAGALALLSAGARVNGEKENLTGLMAIVGGTSSCQLVCSKERIDVPGVWGPYYSALLPGYWLAEAGQSSTGSLVDHFFKTHPAVDRTVAKEKLYEWVETILLQTAAKRGLEDPTELTKQFHVYPDYHGNRAPLADALMTGMVSGLSLSAGREDLAVQYLATLQALAYGTRDILEQLQRCGHVVSAVLLCGGLALSSLFNQTLADVLGVAVGVPANQQLCVVQGAALLAAAAASGGNLLEAIGKSSNVALTRPNEKHSKYHRRKYEVFRKMQADQLQYRAMMNQQ